MVAIQYRALVSCLVLNDFGLVRTRITERSSTAWCLVDHTKLTSNIVHEQR